VLIYLFNLALRNPEEGSKMVRLKHIFLLILTLAFAVGNAFGQRLALLEAEVYGGEEAEYLWPVTIPTDDGGFIISILSESTKEGNLNFSCSIGFERSLVQKYNNQGGMEWERCYTHTSDSA